jgi:hypothetical protein
VGGRFSTPSHLPPRTSGVGKRVNEDGAGVVVVGVKGAVERAAARDGSSGVGPAGREGRATGSGRGGRGGNENTRCSY